MRDYAFLEAAKDEVLDATDWFIERNPSVAIEFLDAVRARVDQAMEFPGAGAREAGGCRSLQVGKYSFRMIYGSRAKRWKSSRWLTPVASRATGKAACSRARYRLPPRNATLGP